MTIAYEISGYDNYSYMTGSCDKLFPEIKHVPKCNKCGFRTDFRFSNLKFKLKRKTLDFSSTYDGVTIVSLKFKEFCHRYGYKNLKFIELPKSPMFYQFYVEGNICNYNANLKKNLCTACNQFESIIGPSFNLEEVNEPLNDGFYHSDLWFGSRNEKSPIIIISPKTKMLMAKEGFKNICFNEIKKQQDTT